MYRLAPSPPTEEKKLSTPVPLGPVTDTGATRLDDIYEVPCFPLLDASDPPDPDLVSVDDVGVFQLEHWTESLGEYLMLETAIDLNDNGVAGTVLPNGEFPVQLPEPTLAITITAALDAPATLTTTDAARTPSIGVYALSAYGIDRAAPLGAGTYASGNVHELVGGTIPDVGAYES
jgi:hypothetical protein